MFFKKIYTNKKRNLWKGIILSGCFILHRVPAPNAPTFPSLSCFDSRATHGRALLPAAFSSMSCG